MGTARAWTEAMDRMLKKLAAQELYTPEIAAKMTKRFGRVITKNSVIGRAHRTGVELSQPGKFERVRAHQGAALQKWLSKPENRAYWLKRHKEGYQLPLSSLERRGGCV